MPRGVVIRPLAPDDAAPARALVAAAVAGTPYAEAPASALAQALEGASDESLGLVALRDDAIVGLALAGFVAGAQGAGRMHLVTVTASGRRAGIGRLLCDAAADALAARGARFVMVEMPDDPLLAPGRALLLRAEFREEARVADYHRDGVAMVVMRREV